MYIPNFLKKDDVIGICAPSAGFTEQVDITRLESAKFNLFERGYEVIETDNVRKCEKGRSSIGKKRAEEFLSLIKILDNAGKYHKFLNEKDESGYSLKEKVIQLLEFRIPYYVGPLNSSKKAKEDGFAWSVRNKGYENTPVTPWNYEKVIDESASAEKFITNLTNK